MQNNVEFGLFCKHAHIYADVRNLEELIKNLCKKHVEARMNFTVLADGYWEWLDWQFFMGMTVGTFLWLGLTVIVAIVLERLITRYVRRFAKRAKLEPNVTNSLVLTFRLLILIGTVTSLVRAGGVPADWVVAFSAVGGAAVGFASTKTIGNFIAGLYLFAARPFRVGDYVKVGTVEGIVEEMTINYTRILTIGNNIVSISNLQILDRDITNYLYHSDDGKTHYCYTFEMTFDHSVSTDKIERIFNEVFEQYKDKFPKEPSYMLARSGGFERVFVVYLYVKNPEDIFTLRPKIAEEIFDLWDKERIKNG